jgi:hypothetical protein
VKLAVPKLDLTKVLEGSAREMELTRSDMQAETLVLGQSSLPRRDFRHRRSLQVKYQPSIDCGSAWNVTDGEAISGDVRLVRETGLKHAESIDHFDPSLFDLGRVALVCRQTYQLHEKRMK